MYDTLLTVSNLIAIAALFAACYGIFDQWRSNSRSQSTRGIEPYRFGALMLSNLAWVAWALGASPISWPLTLGCGLMVLIGGAITVQVLLLPPARASMVRSWCFAVLTVSAIAFPVCVTRSEIVQEIHQPLHYIALGSSIILLHAFTVKQWRYTRRNGIHGVSGREVVTGFLNWSLFLPYPLLLLLDPESTFPVQFEQYWAMVANTLFGVLTTGMRLVQFLSLRKGGDR